MRDAGLRQVGCQGMPERMEISLLVLGINELDVGLFEIGLEGLHVEHEGLEN